MLEVADERRINAQQFSQSFRTRAATFGMPQALVIIRVP
jgi:hypothetical protein